MYSMKILLTGILVLSFINGQSQKNLSMKQVKCVEMVVFRPQKNVTKDELMQAMVATNEVVKNFDGFIHRSTSINEDGAFLDVVYWESKEQALDAASKVQQIPEVMKNFALIDPNSIKMQHFEVFSVQN